MVFFFSFNLHNSDCLFFHKCSQSLFDIFLYIFSSSFIIKFFLQYCLNSFFVISFQFTFKITDTACIRFDRQLKPIFVRLLLVKMIPGILSLYCLFKISLRIVISGAWFDTRSHNPKLELESNLNWIFKLEFFWVFKLKIFELFQISNSNVSSFFEFKNLKYS